MRQMISIIALVAITGTANLCWAADNYALAEDYTNKAQYDEAELAVQQFLAEAEGEQSFVDGQLLLARIHEEQKNYAQSIAAFQSICDQYPQAAAENGAFLRKALLENHTGKKAEAVATCRRFIELFPQHECVDKYDYLLCEVTYADKDYEAAIKQYTGFLQQYPDSSASTHAMIKVSMACEKLAKQLRSTPSTETDYYQNLARADRLESESTMWKQLAEENPDSIKSGLANLNFETVRDICEPLNRWDIIESKALLEISNNPGVASVEMGEVHIYLGLAKWRKDQPEYEGVITVFRDVMDWDPAQFPVDNHMPTIAAGWLALFYEQQGDRIKAADCAHFIDQKMPDGPTRSYMLKILEAMLHPGYLTQ